MSKLIHSALGDTQGVETPFPDSPWVVMKFGGSSVASAERWGTIADLVAARLEEGVRPFVCHSALYGVSNQLVALVEAAVRGDGIEERLQKIRSVHDTLAAALGIDGAILDPLLETLRQLVVGVELIGEATPRVHARVLAFGEFAATKLGASYLQSRGLPVEWIDATTMLEATVEENQTERSGFLSARCDFGADSALQERLESAGKVILTQGFIARSPEGNLVLLGRGGSDVSGAYFAGKLEARRLEIWTDVPGIFSADPHAVPSARLIRSLQYAEAQEIASAGGAVLHPRSIAPVRRSGIPLFLKSTVRPDWEGTVISDSPSDEAPRLKAVSYRSGITLISMESMEMWHQVGFLSQSFDCFRRHGISVDLISTSESNVTVSIDLSANTTNPQAVDALAEELRKFCRVTVLRDCAAISLVGRRIRTILHELTPVLELFEEYKIHLLSQAANDLNLTFVVGSEQAYRLVQHIHGLLVGKFEGGVFGATWEQLSEPAPVVVERPAPWWRKRRGDLLEIAASRNCAYVYDRKSIVEAAARLTGLKNADAVFYAMKANSHVDVLRTIYAEGINLECVSPGEFERAREAIPDLDIERVLFTPNFAPREEYAWALEQGLRVTIDNLYVLRAWGDLFRGKELMVRIDTGQGRGHHEHVRTAGVHSKFGVPLFECDELVDLVQQCGAKVIGLHAHTGSGVLNSDAWHDTGQRLLEIAGRFPDIRYLDLGGGLGIPERPGQAPLDMAALDQSLGAIRAAAGDVEIWLEPGRYLVAESGVLLAQVTQTKGKGGFTYLGVTTGMNSLIRPALYGAYHEIVNLTRLDEPTTELTTVVGPICETGDRLGSDRLLPVGEEGDVLLIANTGAYGFVMGSRYNLREPAAEVVI